jgi:NAD(P)-dependent dehydrogenase (short-subunit alcohol dehydrogenase family)
LAYDLSKYYIRVNVVSPGPVETELWSGMPEETRKGFLKAAGEGSLTHKVGQPEEVAQTYLGLLKDTNITGETLFTDAGSKYGPPPK